MESTIPLLAASLHPVVAPFFYGYRYTIIRDRVFLLFKLDRWHPAIRERRSNSVSQYRSPGRSVRRKKEVNTAQHQATTNGQQAGENNNQEWNDQQRQDGETEVKLANGSSGHTIITMDDSEEQRPNVENGVPPFLFTIGAVDEDEDRMEIGRAHV